MDNLNFDLTETLDALARTPSVLDALLRGVARVWYDRNEGPGAWSVTDVVGHLIHGDETDWIPRARMIIEHGNTRSFEPFDRFAQFNRFEGWTLHERLDRFADLRRANLEIVRNWGLTDAHFSLPGQHPALGPVTLRQLLATWVVHDLDHIGQISRVLAKRYTEDVGPWREYLRILE